MKIKQLLLLKSKNFSNRQIASEVGIDRNTVNEYVRKLLASGSDDKTVKIWDANEVKLLLTLNSEKHGGHTHSVNKLMWCNYKNYLISTGDDCTIKVWEVLDKINKLPL